MYGILGKLGKNTLMCTNALARIIMAKIEFDNEFSRLVEEFNASAGARTRRSRILAALELKTGQRVLDVGSGPGHQAFEISQLLGDSGRVDGVDPAEDALDIARHRCSDLTNVCFQAGTAVQLPFDDASFDSVMSSQVFEYLDNVETGLAEAYRVLKPRGRILIHDTDWGALLWRSNDPARMRKVKTCWDGHLVDPHLPQSLGKKLASTGFVQTKVEPIVHVETELVPNSMSEVLIRIIAIYILSQGMPASEVAAWESDLRELGKTGDYFFSSNEYLFTAVKP